MHVFVILKILFLNFARIYLHFGIKFLIWCELNEKHPLKMYVSVLLTKWVLSNSKHYKWKKVNYITIQTSFEALNLKYFPKDLRFSRIINSLHTQVSEWQTRWVSEIVPVRKVTEREHLIKHLFFLQRLFLFFPASFLWYTVIHMNHCTSAPPSANSPAC